MEVIDNFLDQEDFKELQNLIIFNEQLPWYCARHVANITTSDGFYFIHTIYTHDEPISMLYKDIKEKILYKLGYKSLIRCKINLFPQSETLKSYDFHKDQPYKHKDAIFYLNTNNGFTLFKDGTKIESIENRLLLFENNEEHASTNCTDEYARYNINFNYF